jgi:hypothetical protein
MTITNGANLLNVHQAASRILPDGYSSGSLMSRDRLGVPLREHIMRELTRMRGGETLVADFSGIEEMTTSIAEEIGPKLFQEFLSYRAQGDVYFAYCNLSEEIARGFHHALRSWQPRVNSSDRVSVVAFGTYQNGRFSQHRFLGETIPDALREALDLIYRLGKANSSQLEARGVKAASRKLNQLFSEYPWLLQRFQESLDVGPRAWAYFYSPIVPVLGIQEENNV